MTVKESAIVYLALMKFVKNNNLSFKDAMNIVKLENQLYSYFKIVVNKEKYIVNTYGKRDDKGNLIDENDNPVFVDTEESKKALVGLHELYEQKIEDEITKIKVAMPEKKGNMTLTEIEALMEVIDFE